MQIRFRDRLSYKQARYTISTAILLGLLLSVFQVFSDYNSQDQLIDDNTESYIAVTLTPAARIAYNLDKELASELVNGLIQSPTIIKADIIDPSGIALAAASKEIQRTNERPFIAWLFGDQRTYIHELKVPFDKEEQLGWLRVVADPIPFGEQFLSRAVVTLTTGLIRALVLSLVLFITLYFTLTRPLLEITKKIVAPTDGIRRIKLPESQSHQRDEIGLLTRTINHYLNNIHHHLHHRRLAEEQLREHLAELETTIARRTREIRANNKTLEDTNVQLEQARKKALETASIRADQLASLSHEIRTPLNALIGMLDIALEDEENDNQLKRLTIARNSGAHLVRLLSDILDLSRLESGKMSLEKIPFDLRKALEDLVILTGQSTFRKGVPIYCDIDPTLPEEVIGDPTRFQQVISNLISNAAKFTDEGSIRIWLDCQMQPDNNIQVMINITDTGIGIPDSALDEIFKPFAQASVDTSRKFGGSGMGLPLTQSIVQNMGGNLTVISEPEEGSTFSVKLPFLLLSKTSEPEVPSAPKQSEITLYCHHALQTCCSHQLTHWGYEHQTLVSNDLVALLDQWTDILITDDVTFAKEALQEKQSIHIILVSFSEPELNSSRVFWLSHPFARDQLLEALVHCCPNTDSQDGES